MFQAIKNALNKINIKGRNLGTTEKVNFDLLSEHFKDVDDPKILKTIKKIEELYLKIYELSLNEEHASCLPIDGDKVEIPQGTYFHLTPPSLEQLKNISMAGVLASEWFGVVESEREALFCSFLNTVRSKEEDAPNSSILIKRNENAYLCKWGDCSLFFNQDNPLVQKLIKLDFFEYAHMKSTNPEEIPQKYSSDEIEILEFIYDNSGGRNFHDNPNDYMGRDLWHAIPGGIPSMLVSGVCVNMTKSKSQGLQELQDNIQMVSKCFPNAVIFDENQRVLAYPKNYQEQKVNSK